MIPPIVTYNAALEEFTIVIPTGDETVHIWADDFEIQRKMGQLLLRARGQIVSILKIDYPIGLAVLGRLEKIRKQDEAPQAGADSSL